MMRTENEQLTSGLKMFIVEEPPVTGARIKVIGVGGGGGNAVNHMIQAGVQGVEFIVANTDVQALKLSNAPYKIQLGSDLTKGLGAGADPSVGHKAALEDTNKILDAIEGADMVFVTSGLGGGTGTGAAPVIAALAMESGILTVAVVTKPFEFEGRRRMRHAEKGLAELRGSVDTIIVIPNDKLESLEEGISVTNSFKNANEVLLQAVQGITDLITIPGLINLDFADVRSVMRDMGMALMGVGRARGEGRGVAAMRAAIESKLLEENAISGAKGVLVNITFGSDMPLREIKEAVSLVEKEATEDANIIFGAVVDESMSDEVKVTVIATGFDKQDGGLQEAPIHQTLQAQPRPIEMPLTNRPTRNDNFDIPTFIRKKAD